MLDFFRTFWWLMAAHALTDYALQSEFIATYKDPNYWDEKRGKVGPWLWIMSSHALINGGGVALVTGSVVLGVLECVAHFILDTAKCLGVINTHVDQYGHVLTKVAWAFLVTFAR